MESERSRASIVTPALASPHESPLALAYPKARVHASAVLAFVILAGWGCETTFHRLADAAFPMGACCCVYFTD